MMSGQTCIDAVAALAHLAVADPYTAVEASGALPPEPCHLPAATAVSATNPPTTLMQASNPVQLSPQQSTASALHLLQQLLASPSKSNDSASDGEVNSKAVSVCQASGLHSWSETLRPVLTTPAETASGLGEPSTRQARDLPADTLAALPPTAAGAQQEVLDWTIIDDFCSRTVPRSRLRLLLHAWQDVARSHTKWRCIQQELLLRRCVVALLSWHRIAALESKRTGLLAHHLRQQHQLRSLRLAFQAWRDAAAVATAQSRFVMQLLSVEDKAMLTGSLRAWRAQCHTGQSASGLRAEERMQSLRQAMTAWQQWCLFRHYQGTAATAFHRKQVEGRAVHCWRTEWLVRGRAKRQLAKQQQYKIQFLQGRWRLLQLHSILASWLSIAAAQATSRAHLSHTLQHVQLQQVLQAWSMKTKERIRLKGAALGAWSEHVRWHRLKPRLLSAALHHRQRRLWQKALRAWVSHWYLAASGSLIAARHCQTLTAAAMHALRQHAWQQKAKYAAWRAATLHWKCTILRAFCRGCAVSQQRGCMHELALMFHWACLARHHLRRWQAYTYQQLAKKQRWALAVLHYNLGSQGALFAQWAKWFVWQQRKELSQALGRRAILRDCLTRWQQVVLQSAAVTEAFKSVQVKKLVLVSLQRWHQLVLYKREVYPQMLSSYLRAWAAYAQRLPLLRFLLLEHMAIKQARQKGAVLTAWRYAAASHKAEAQKHCQQHVAVCLALDGTAGAQRPASEAGWAVQMAFQGWRAVVLHMAARRGQLQQAALASAERAIQRGCHAASGLTDVSNPPSIDVATDPSVQLSFPGHQGESCIPVEQQWEHNLKHTHLVGFVQTSESSLMEVVAATVHQDAAELTAAFFKASAHWAEQLQARVLHAWRELSRQAIASVWQQHELKAAANQQLLQLVLRQQHANGHRRQRLLACIFYPWLECSLRRLDAQRMRLQPENQYPDIAADRTQPVPYEAASAGMQAPPLQPQLLADIAIPGKPARSACSLYGCTGSNTACDTACHSDDWGSQCSKAALLEIPVNNNCASGFEHRACQASQSGKAGVALFGKVGLGLSARQEGPSNCKRDSNGTLKQGPCSGRVANTSSGGNPISSIKQHSAAHQATDLAQDQIVKRPQGRDVQNVSEPVVLPKHGHLVSIAGQQGRCQHAEADSRMKQAATAGQARGSHKASNSTADRRKALMKAIVRTTPTRAPSMPLEADQPNGSGAAKTQASSSQPQCDTMHIQSFSALDAMFAQIKQPPRGQPHITGGPVLPTCGLEPRLKSDWGNPSIAESCKAVPTYVSAMRQVAPHTQPGTKDAAGVSLGSAGTRVVRRSLLSQPDFC